VSEIGIAGSLFLLIFVFVLPFLVVKKTRAQRAAEAAGKTIERSRYFLAVLINQAVFGILGIAVARAEWVDIFARGSISAAAAALAAGTLAVAVASVPLRWKLTPDDERRRLLAARPEKAGDLGLWFLVSLAAGFIEEIVYRGVMATLLERITGSFAIAAVVSVAAFVLAHGGRGRHRLVVIGALAIVFHVLVRMTGTLFLAMTLHFLYDFLAGVVYIRLGKRMPPAPAHATAAPTVAPPVTS